MRLLDHIAQCTDPFLVRQNCGDIWRLTGAADFSAALARCPLRYVLADELVRACVELAYSEGDALSGCLDLVHLPAERLWVEWSEPARREALGCVFPQWVPPDDTGLERSGVLICAARGGRSGSLRTFFLPSLQPREPMAAALETLLELDGGGAAGPPEALLKGGAVSVCDPQNGCVNELLRCARFRLDSAWRRYYGSVLSDPLDPVQGARVTRLLISSVALDIPMLLALFPTHDSPRGFGANRRQSRASESQARAVRAAAVARARGGVDPPVSAGRVPKCRTPGRSAKRAAFSPCARPHRAPT